MKSVKKTFTLTTSIFLLAIGTHAQIFVTPDGVGDGSSWTNAYNDIQTAIDAASSGDEIWIKEGTYLPTSSTDRSMSFTLQSGVKLYGGFAGTETSIDQRVLSDIDANGTIDKWEFANPTILSGDLLQDATNTNNSYHIVMIPDGVTSTTLLNGFTIADGYNDQIDAQTDGKSGSFASGIVALGGTIEQCVFKDCSLSSTNLSYGAAMYVSGTTVSETYISDCSNMALAPQGGGIYLTSSSTFINGFVENCYAESNGTSNSSGGGIFSESSTITNSIITSCYIQAQTGSSTNGGGGIYSQSSQIDSCIVSKCEALGVNTKGGGIFNIGSTIAFSKIYNCHSDIAGGGVYSESSVIFNSLLFNNNSAQKGGGLYANNDSYIINNNIVNNTCSDSGASGCGIYTANSCEITNNVIWGNAAIQASSTEQLFSDGTSTISYCAIQDETEVDNNINLSSDNSGTDAVNYPKFVSPTSFAGISDGTTSQDDEIEAADWDIEKTSSLIEMGYNAAFDESGQNLDINNNGTTSENIYDFIDFNRDSRLFNASVDIGAYESIFIDLVLPDEPTIEYGTLLSEVELSGGSAIDNSDGTTITGTYTFVDGPTMPTVDNSGTKYSVVFIADDRSTYPDKYSTLAVNVTSKTITVSGINVDDKTYDGNTDATLSGTPALEGVVGSDDVSLVTTSVTASFDDKNVGTDKTVTFSGFTLDGTDKDNYTLNLSSGTASITTLTINVSTLTANNKTYDQTTSATYSETPALVGTIDGDDLSIVAGDANFADANVADNITVTYSNFALSGTDASNYTLTQPVDSYANIEPITLTVNGIDINDKTYDATTDATFIGTPYLSGILDGDDVTLNTESLTALFETKTVGEGKIVYVDNILISGSAIGNYTISATGTFTASILTKELTVTGLGAEDKIYDKTTDATLTGTPTLQGAISGDDVSIDTSLPSASFEDANVGTNKSVMISDYVLSGTDKDNYTITQPSITASINQRSISITAEDKTMTYEETEPALTYIITYGEVVTGDDFTGSLEREAGTNVKDGGYTINIGTLTLGDNYAISFTSGTFTITQAENIITFSMDSETDFELNKTITLSATSSNGATVTFSSSNTDIATIEGTVLTIVSYGTINILADCGASQNYSAATTVSLPFSINLAVNALQKGTSMVLIDNSQEQFESYQWYLNGSAISNATKQFYYSEGGLDGEYYCIVTTTTNDTFDSNTLSISQTKSVSVFPTPASVGQNINIELTNTFETDDEPEVTHYIYDITGKLIKTITQAQDIETLRLNKKGVYIIKTEGAINSTKKIIVN